MIDWIVQNWETLAAGVMALHMAASAFVALTPTPKDDEAYASLTRRIYKVVEALALVVGKAKDTGKR